MQEARNLEGPTTQPRFFLQISYYIYLKTGKMVPADILKSDRGFPPKKSNSGLKSAHLYQVKIWKVKEDGIYMGGWIMHWGVGRAWLK